MSEISKSPNRHTFQLTGYIERANAGDEAAKQVIEVMTQFYNRSRAKESEPSWAENNLEYDLRTTDWILKKVRTDKVYAQQLYAALCNNDFQKLELIPILKEQRWSCSWRHAGGIIADMRQEGDYIDWYLTGNLNGNTGEGIVCNHIRDDLKHLGWKVWENQ